MYGAHAQTYIVQLGYILKRTGELLIQAGGGIPSAPHPLNLAQLTKFHLVHNTTATAKNIKSFTSRIYANRFDTASQVMFHRSVMLQKLGNSQDEVDYIINRNDNDG